MKKIIIVHKGKNSPSVGEFKTEQECLDWLEKQKGKPGRKGEYWSKEKPEDHDEVGYETRTVDNGDGTFSYEYKIPAEFTYEITDISEEVQKRQSDSELYQAFLSVFRELAEELEGDERDADNLKKAMKKFFKKAIKDNK